MIYETITFLTTRKYISHKLHGMVLKGDKPLSSLLMQAVDINSLNIALDKWFEGLDVDRSGNFLLLFINFTAHL